MTTREPDSRAAQAVTASIVAAALALPGVAHADTVPLIGMVRSTVEEHGVTPDTAAIVVAGLPKVLAHDISQGRDAVLAVDVYIRQVHAALHAGCATGKMPAVPVSESVSDEAIICLECGKPHKMLRRHLHSAHGLTERDYKAKWGLAADYPLTAPGYSRTRSSLAREMGLGTRRGGWPRTTAATAA